ARFREQADIGPHYLWPEDSTPIWHFSVTTRHTPSGLAGISEHHLSLLIEQDMERLVRTLLLPKYGENELRRDAMLGALPRLGQIYQYCRRKWKKARARELVWSGVQRVCLEANKAARILEMGRQAEARIKAWDAEQREVQRQALARLGEYAI